MTATFVDRSDSEQRKGSAMVQAIRDQWAVVVAVIALVGLVVWLWRTRSKASASRAGSRTS